MEIAPRPGVSGKSVLDNLDEVIRSLQDIYGGNNDWSSIYDKYVQWSSNSIRLLSGVIDQNTLNRLITTPRHWALVTMTHFIASNVLSLTNTEVDERKRELTQVRDKLEMQIKRWQGVNGDFAIADTNVYLHSEQIFYDLDWRQILETRPFTELHVVIPTLVLKELDRNKRRSRGVTVSDESKEEVRTRARRTLKKINELFPEPTYSPILAEGSDNHAATRISLLLDDLTHSRLPDADSEILDRALYLQDISGKPITILTRDHHMNFSAKSLGLKVKLLE